MEGLGVTWTRPQDGLPMPKHSACNCNDVLHAAAFHFNEQRRATGERVGLECPGLEAPEVDAGVPYGGVSRIGYVEVLCAVGYVGDKCAIWVRSTRRDRLSRCSCIPVSQVLSSDEEIKGGVMCGG